MTNDPQTQQQVLEDSIGKRSRYDQRWQTKNGGASFETLVAQYSDDEGSKQKLGDFGFFRRGQM